MQEQQQEQTKEQSDEKPSERAKERKEGQRGWRSWIVVKGKRLGVYTTKGLVCILRKAWCVYFGSHHHVHTHMYVYSHVHTYSQPRDGAWRWCILDGVPLPSCHGVYVCMCARARVCVRVVCVACVVCVYAMLGKEGRWCSKGVVNS